MIPPNTFRIIKNFFIPYILSLIFRGLIIDKFDSLNNTVLYTSTLLITSNFRINWSLIFIDSWAHKYGHNPIINSHFSTFLSLHFACDLVFMSITRLFFYKMCRKALTQCARSLEGLATEMGIGWHLGTRLLNCSTRLLNCSLYH